MSEKWTNPAARKTKMLLLIGPSTGMTAGVAGVLTGLMTDLEILTLMLAAAGVAGQVIPALAVAAHSLRRIARVAVTGRLPERDEPTRLAISGYLASFAIAIPGGLGAAILGGAEERPGVGMGGAILVGALCLAAAWLNLRLMRVRPNPEGRNGQAEQTG